MGLYNIRFPEVTPAVASGYANKLLTYIQNVAGNDARIERKRTSPSNMDIGTMLEIVIVEAIAKALVEEIARRIVAWLTEQESDSGMVVLDIEGRDRTLRLVSRDPQTQSQAKIVDFVMETKSMELRRGASQ